MGYACPVCGAPQADGEHLANHLAFSALLGHADHEAWLDEHAPGWTDDGPADLAERVTPDLEEVDYPTVTGDPGEGSSTLPEELPEVDPTSAVAGPIPPDLDPEVRRAIEEAREMTRRRQADDEKG